MTCRDRYRTLCGPLSNILKIRSKVITKTPIESFVNLRFETIINDYNNGMLLDVRANKLLMYD